MTLALVLHDWRILERIVGLTHRLSLDRDDTPAGQSRSGSQSNGRNAARASNLQYPLGFDAGGQSMDEFGAGRLQIAMALGLWEPLGILLQLACPQAVDLGALFGS